MTGFLAAVSFLTRVPVRLRKPPELSAAVPWFGLVGVLIGAAVGGVAAGLGEWMPPLPTAATAVVFGLVVTGAFHEDGLADIADAFTGGWTREDRLRILKDPRHGTYGVAALCGSVVIRVAAVASLAPAAAFASLVAAHALARAAAVGVMATVPTATSDGLGARYGSGLRRGQAAAGITAATALAALATGWWIGPLAAAALASAAAVAWLSMRKIGGLTGDVLGAVEQVAECLILLVATGLASHYPVWWR